MLERLVPRPLLSGRADGYLKPRPEPALLSSFLSTRVVHCCGRDQSLGALTATLLVPACCPRELYGVPGNEMPDSLCVNAQQGALQDKGQGLDTPPPTHPGADGKFWTHPDWRAQKTLYYSDEIDSPQLVFTPTN